MRGVVADANVLVSFFVERNTAQRNAARTFLVAAEEGEISGFIPQAVIFEVAYVLKSQYGLDGRQIAVALDAITSFPGVQIVDDCPWKRVLEIWPERLSGLADAVIVTIAGSNGYDAIATFDRKLANKLEAFGLASYF